MVVAGLLGAMNKAHVQHHREGDRGCGGKDMGAGWHVRYRSRPFTHERFFCVYFAAFSLVAAVACPGAASFLRDDPVVLMGFVRVALPVNAYDITGAELIVPRHGVSHGEFR